ncbi:hypothetical protein LN040_13510 [Desulfovibrio subterraneus]|uniref:hypothetical protein n=1 Tax=Desulfovibrio subterraneus TaxID=2718620 RepID=UPI0022B8D2FF|nr:hypothetical protein [Desulfovibrio subterraneus]WBF66733.1 hypothetical protein LN040_13510 [Desulfovibrio subterraneus]
MVGKKKVTGSTKAGLPVLGVATQGVLFRVEKQVEYRGVEMGVLENGTPYLTESGLARMCGVDRKVINRLASNWNEEKAKPRGKKVAKILNSYAYDEDYLYAPSEYNGVKVNAYTEKVCISLLEYYAFVAEDKKEQAVIAFRLLARQSFRDLIYGATGYSPSVSKLDSWKHFHDRVDLTHDAVPVGYFSVFREIASIIVPMIRSGIIISDKVIPDISVGKAWSAFWADNGLDAHFGERRKFNHEYPDYYPQSKSNPQPAYAYPDEALGYFRQWLRANYLVVNFPKYLSESAKKGKISRETALKAIDVFREIGEIEE